MGSRRKARIIAFQSLYRFDVGKPPIEDLFDYFWLNKEQQKKFDQDTIDFSRLLIAGTMENLEFIDNVIKKQLEHWDFKRLARVDLSLLRIAVYSLFFQKDIPVTVTIDEAIDIAKKYGTDDSYRFINGMLDGIRKKYKL